MSILLILIFLLVIIAVAIAVTWKRFDGGKAPPNKRPAEIAIVRKTAAVRPAVLVSAPAAVLASSPAAVLASSPAAVSVPSPAAPAVVPAELGDEIRMFSFFPLHEIYSNIIPSNVDDVTHISGVVNVDDHIIIITKFNDVLSCNIKGYDYKSHSEDDIVIETPDDQYILNLTNENGKYTLSNEEHDLSIEAKSCILEPALDDGKVYTMFNDKKYTFLPSGNCAVSMSSMMSSNNGHTIKASQEAFICDGKRYMFINIDGKVYVLIPEDKKVLEISMDAKSP